MCSVGRILTSSRCIHYHNTKYKKNSHSFATILLLFLSTLICIQHYEYLHFYYHCISPSLSSSIPICDLPLLELVTSDLLSLPDATVHLPLYTLSIVPFFVGSILNLPLDPTNGVFQATFSHTVWCFRDLCFSELTRILTIRVPVQCSVVVGNVMYIRIL